MCTNNPNYRGGDGGVLTARIDSRFQSAYQVDWRETAALFGGGHMDMSGYRHQKAHHIDDVSLIYANPDGRWTLTGYVKNLWNYAEKRFLNLKMSKPAMILPYFSTRRRAA